VPDLGANQVYHTRYEADADCFLDMTATDISTHPLQRGPSKKMSATEASFYGLEREKKGIDRVVECLNSNIVGNLDLRMYTDRMRWFGRIAKKLIEAGLDPTRLK